MPVLPRAITHVLTPSLLAASVASCAASSPPALANRANRASQANQAPPPCTTSQLARISARLRIPWRLDSEVSLRCVAGAFPAPGYFVEARWDDATRAGILDASLARELVPRADAAAGPARPLEAFALDLDGDGTDEIIERWRDTADGRRLDWLVVRRITGGQLQEIVGPPVP